MEHGIVSTAGSGLTVGLLLCTGRFTLPPDTFSSLLLGSLPAGSLSSLLVGSLATGQKPSKPATALPHMHYTGSLTTPPCSEDVSWYAFATFTTMCA
jgi:Eukaryotic-type carbonic anhydrase